MSKVVLYIAMSLDGYLAGPNEDLAWLNSTNDYDDEGNKKAGIKQEEDSPYEYDKFFSTERFIISPQNGGDLCAHWAGGKHNEI
jgi:hypothetical protein